MSNQLYRSSELLKATGCTRKALRVYQANGLIRSCQKHGAERFDRSSLVRLRLIVRLRRMGLSVERIREIIDIPSDSGGNVPAALQEAVTEVIQEATARIEELQRLRNEMASARERLFKCSSCDRAMSACRACADNGRLDPMSEALLVRPRSRPPTVDAA